MSLCSITPSNQLNFWAAASVISVILHHSWPASGCSLFHGDLRLLPAWYPILHAPRPLSVDLGHTTSWTTNMPSGLLLQQARLCLGITLFLLPSSLCHACFSHRRPSPFSAIPQAAQQTTYFSDQQLYVVATTVIQASHSIGGHPTRSNNQARCQHLSLVYSLTVSKISFVTASGLSPDDFFHIWALLSRPTRRLRISMV